MKFARWTRETKQVLPEFWRESAFTIAWSDQGKFCCKNINLSGIRRRGRFYKLMEKVGNSRWKAGMWNISWPQQVKDSNSRQLTRVMVRYFSNTCMHVWGGTCSQENVNCLGSYKARQFFIPKLTAPFFYLGLSGIEIFFFFWKYTNDILKAERMRNSKGVRANLGVGLLF